MTALIRPLLLFNLLAMSVSSLPSFTDPLWNASWHLSQGNPSMRIREAWALGLSGRGVKVRILDTGIDRYHPDLYFNYSPRLSFDFVGNVSDPHIANATAGNPHGTNMAGLIAASGNNSLCGVGVAFRSSIGMGRILTKKRKNDVSDFILDAMAHRKEETDLIVMAFGPSNGGVGIGSLSPEEETALRDSVSGRQGKGNILMLSTGNSGSLGDSCSFNAFSQSIHTASINAVGRNGEIPYYAERCASIMASAFSSTYKDRLATTTLGGGCDESFGGTSGSNAVASGVLALALEANPDLTWRDAQHLLVRAGRSAGLDPKAVWNKNAAGHLYSPVFGYGLIDAYALATMAANWTSVPPQVKCEVKLTPQTLISGKDIFTDSTEVEREGCNIRHLEHVQVELTAYSLCRGNVNLELVSPGGTLSKILTGRKNDFANTGFNGWALLSVEFWGEYPLGEWSIRVFRSPCVVESRIAFQSWKLVLYGTPNK